MQQKGSEEEASLIWNTILTCLKAMTTPQYIWFLGSYLNTWHPKYEAGLSHSHNYPT